ncbi:MAG: hypothetical protein PHD05_09550, partial [Sphaerochaetaceae bacterium]|nr:hypothetical protein [Sphaerochaetaceae bacterium]
MLLGHKKQWEFLKNKFEMGQLSHAYLFAGPREIGKKNLAFEFIKLLNCIGKIDESKKPCDRCTNCQMINKCTFPDLMVISSLNKKDPNYGDGGEIKISQIREAQDFLNYKSYYGSFKSVIVNDAENMNTEAQNCFLKTLEEPKGRTLLVMTSSKPEMLLPTIISRCQTLKFFKTSDLPENSERLIREKNILENLVPIFNSDFSKKFKYTKDIDFDKQDFGEILEVILKYLRYMLLVELGIEKEKENMPIEKK